MTQNQEITYIGVDIAKQTLEVAGESTKPMSLSNNAEGHSKLIGWLQKLPGPVRVICEATGGYEKQMIQALVDVGLEVCRVNPLRVRHFARALGRMAKTDRIDASLLALYGRQIQPRPVERPAAANECLRALFDRRQQLIEQRTAESNRLDTADKTLAPLIKKMLAFLEKQITQMEQMIDEHIDQNPGFKTKVNRMEQVKGIGRVTSTVLLAHMPELGSLDRRQAAALAGVAPFNRDSGPVEAKRSISGGRPEVRQILYMAAMAAAKYNHILRPFYSRLISRGKKHKVAIVAVMRKLIILLNHLLKNPNFTLA